MIVYENKKRGRGLVNSLIDRLPVEFHLPGYQYCGPGTNLRKRLKREDPGINPLDAACKEHDIAYSNNQNNIEARHVADRALADKAWQRVLAKDAGLKEKVAAYAVTNAMNLKTKFGMGLKKQKKRFPLNMIIKAAKSSMTPHSKSQVVIKSALKGANDAVKQAGGTSCIKIPRILPISSKIGGFLPYLVPLFAGLSATGALAGGASGIIKAINDTKAAREHLEESKRHNKSMESIALGKGLYLRPHKTRMGIYLKPYAGKGLKKKILTS